MHLLTPYVFHACDLQYSDGPHENVTVTGPCIITKKIQQVTVKAADLNRYREGEYVQSCFPYLSAGDREFLQSGYSDEGWSLMFPEEE